MKNLQTQGISYPQLGLGTYRMQGEVCRDAVSSALDLGYRHIDTAAMYGNEDAVGAAIAASSVSRDELHVTTKIWHANLAPAALKNAFDESLDKLKLDYVDLIMVHWPAPQMDLAATLEALVKLKDQGRARAVGVCNFTVALLREAVEEIGAPIACNQVEYHVLLDQSPLRAYMKSQGIPLTAYAPLAQGTLAQHPELLKIATKHSVSPAQVALKWLLEQDDVAAIPKAQHRASQQANLDALKLELDQADRQAIAALPKDQRFVNPPFAPKWDTAAA